ncbi:hypothetical protein SLE2022_164810 [Rubroshorea leprosula]
MSNFGGFGNGVQGLSNNLTNIAPCNLGTGSGSQNYGQGSGSNHLNGGNFNFSPSLALGNPCGAPVNIGPGAGGRSEGSAAGSLNTFNAPANLASGFPCF